MSAITAPRLPRDHFELKNKLRDGAIALIFISAFFVKIEPAPVDVFSVLAFAFFLTGGLRFSRSWAVPLIFLMLYILGGFLSTIPVMITHDGKFVSTPYEFPIVLTQISLTGLLIAGYIYQDPERRYLKVESAWWIGGTIGAVLALLLYYQFPPVVAFFKIFGYEKFSEEYYRATGGYKDPNVFSTWLCFPAISMLQALVTGRLRPGVISLGSFAAVLAALFLAFSRGAWLVMAAGGLGCLLLTLVLTPSRQQRIKITFLSVTLVMVVVVLLAALLTIPSVADQFEERFHLLKSYDSGETGRFGNQLNSITMLMRLPLGFGPYQFSTIFHIEPHNTFLNAFASAGWLGGLSYLLLFISICAMGWRAMFQRSPFQPQSIALFCTFIVMLIQGLQIGNEHWRHIWWMLGMSWALFAAGQEARAKGFTAQELNVAWNIPSS